MDLPVTIPLSQPMTNAKGEKLEALTLRPPTAGDIRRCGYPFTLRGSDDNAEMVPNPGAVSLMISETAGVIISEVDKMPIRDWNAAMFAIMSFFGGRPDQS